MSVPNNDSNMPTMDELAKQPTPGSVLLRSLLELAVSIGPCLYRLDEGRNPRLEKYQNQLRIEPHELGEAKLTRLCLEQIAEQLLGGERWSNFVEACKTNPVTWKVVSTSMSFDLTLQYRIVFRIAHIPEPLRPNDSPGLMIELRLNSRAIPSLESLGFREDFLPLTKQPHGLIAVFSNQAHGKSTTVAALVDRINSTQRRRIVTVEQAVEYVHKNKLSTVMQLDRKDRRDSYEHVIEEALALKPEVLYVDQPTSLRTCELLIQGAGLGMLVIITKFARGSFGPLNQLFYSVPDEQRAVTQGLLADNLCGVITQRLKKLGSNEGVSLEYKIHIPDESARNTLRVGSFDEIYYLEKRFPPAPWTS